MTRELLSNHDPRSEASREREGSIEFWNGNEGVGGGETAEPPETKASDTAKTDRGRDEREREKSRTASSQGTTPTVSRVPNSR